MVVDETAAADGVDVTADDEFVACTKFAASDTPSGIPFVKNSTATSGFPCAARKQCRTSGSGNPILVKLLTTSSGNTSTGLGASGAVTAVDVAAGVVVVDAVSTTAAALVGVGATAAAAAAAVVAVSTAVITAGGAATAGDRVAAVVVVSLGTAAFFAFVTITTKKSFSFIPQALSTSSSFNIFPE